MKTLIQIEYSQRQWIAFSVPTLVAVVAHVLISERHNLLWVCLLVPWSAFVNLLLLWALGMLSALFQDLIKLRSDAGADGMDIDAESMAGLVAIWTVAIVVKIQF